MLTAANSVSLALWNHRLAGASTAATAREIQFALKLIW